MSNSKKTAGSEMVPTAAAPGEPSSWGEEGHSAEAVRNRDIKRVLPNLRRYARSLTHNAVDADDLVQEYLAQALAKLPLWKVGTDLKAWLSSILHNEYVTQIRRAARQGCAVDWSECQPALSCAPNQIEHLEIRDRARGLTSLSEEQRTAVLMTSFSGDYYKAASACNVPIGTMRFRPSRGRKALRALMSVASLQQRLGDRCARAAQRGADAIV